MAEMTSQGEGSNADSQEPSTGEPSIEQINAELQMAPPPPPESYGDWRASIQANEGWLQAIAKDERAERVQNNRHTNPAQTSRHTRVSRGAYLARQDWQRTVRGVERQVHSWNSGHHDGWGNSPGKGHDLTWYRDRYGHFVADVVGFWRAFWYGH
jgi:hypothetical protein